jgi:hypothetical protein
MTDQRNTLQREEPSDPRAAEVRGASEPVELRKDTLSDLEPVDGDSLRGGTGKPGSGGCGN